MTDSTDYTSPKIWAWNKENGGKFASINRTIAGPAGIAGGAPSVPAAELKPLLADQWLKDNKTSLDAYNAFVKRYGVFSDGLRGF